MRLADLNTDAAVVTELGLRIARHRRERNWTQADFAREAGVGQATVQRVERGRSVQMTTMVRLLRTLDLLGALDDAIPESVRLPIAELEREQRRKTRQRVRARRELPSETQGERWTWGDESPRMR
jgi:transcriptional regulator with XRE-family HTH domain